MESANFKLLDDECLVIDNFDKAPPSLSHGDLVFDPRSDLFQGEGDDAEHPTVIIMSRVRLESDTCDLYFSYKKVNLLLYTCSLDPFEDGILLDTSPVCMHRYCRSFTDIEKECKHQGTTTPFAREAWKRRRKKTELLKLQRPDIRARGRTSGACATSEELHQQDGRSISGRTSGTSATPGHPALSTRNSAPLSREHHDQPREPGHPARQPGHPAPRERPDIRHPVGHPAPAYAHGQGSRPMYPFPTYPFVAKTIYTPSPSSS